MSTMSEQHPRNPLVNVKGRILYVTQDPASLEKRKIYIALSDTTAEKRGLLRIIDESGDDYLYPRSFFRSIALPQSVRKAVLAAA